MLIVKKYFGIWILEAIDYNIQLFDGNNITDHSWRQLNNCNDSSKKCFIIIRIMELCKPILLLYNPGF